MKGRSYRAQQASYTTCGPANEDWFIRARELDIDNARDRGVARDAKIVFMDQTIFYTPYISFSLHQQRKSGLLTPHYGSVDHDRRRIDRPLLLEHRAQPRRHVLPPHDEQARIQLGTEFRYLEPTTAAMRVEYLPNDRQENASGLRLFLGKHAQTFGEQLGCRAQREPGLRRSLLHRSLDVDHADIRARRCRREVISRAAAHGATPARYALSAFAQSWQTLQTDPLAPIVPPYNRLPQLTLSAFRQDVLKSDFDLLTSYVDFQHPTLVNGQRFARVSELPLPLQTSYAYLIPEDRSSRDALHPRPQRAGA